MQANVIHCIREKPAGDKSPRQGHIFEFLGMTYMKLLNAKKYLVIIRQGNHALYKQTVI